MATKRKKKKGKAKKKRPGRAFLIFAPVLAGGMVLIMLYFLTQSANTTAVPAYEEFLPATSELHRKIAEVDRVIYECLYRENIPEENVLFLNVDPRRGESRDWDFTELRIKFSNKQSVVELDKEIRHALTQLKPPVSFRSEKSSDREIVSHVFVNGSYTHKLTLSYEIRKSPVPRKLPKIAFIIDDLGYDHGMASRFMETEYPFSLSLLPIAPQTRRIAEEANRRGTELILHLPMEPSDYPRINPGPGVLLTDMSDEEIRRTLGEHLKRVSGARGVNNHMGSRFTQQPDKMRVVLSEMKERGLFWVDSRTTSLTVGHRLARDMGVATAQRNVFLDNELSASAVEVQMKRLMAIARHSGAAIGIGHPHRVTLDILKKYSPRLKEEFEVVRVSDLVS